HSLKTSQRKPLRIMGPRRHGLQTQNHQHAARKVREHAIRSHLAWMVRDFGRPERSRPIILLQSQGRTGSPEVTSTERSRTVSEIKNSKTVLGADCRITGELTLDND